MSAKSKPTCDICGNSFSRHRNLVRHKRSVHEILTDHQTRPSRIHCPSENCQFTCKYVSLLRDHFDTDHGVKVKHVSVYFDNDEEFFAWKKKEEKCTKSSFVKHNSAKKLVDGTVRHHYRCFRSGRFTSDSKGHPNTIRRLKKQGSGKIDGFCPAEMIVDSFPYDGHTLVRYYQTHFGHDHELVHLHLTSDERIKIAEKLRQLGSLDAVLDEFRDDININADDRLFLLTRKDIHNIGLTYNINVDYQPFKEYILNADVWVANIRNSQQENPILYYKKQSHNDPNSTLDDNDFMLVLMTSAQKAIFLEYGSKVICVVSTHGTNTYDFQLSTIMVIDDCNEAYPVAFCLSNRVDETAMQVFFETVKKLIGDLQTETYMSYESTSYNAWKNVMLPVEQHLLCTWHVDRSWKNNLFNKVKKRLKIPSLYKTLRKLLIEELDPNEFQKLLSEFLNTLKNDEDMVEFHEYFVKYYANTYEFWARCYRKRSSINTSISFAALHCILKRIYFQVKPNHVVDCVDNLMEFMAVKGDNVSTIKSEHRLTSALEQIYENHVSGVSIPFENINPVDLDKWRISSQICTDTYTVEKINEECSYKNCKLRCHDCNICIHEYRCNCPDYSMKNIICEHIHCIVSYCMKFDIEEVFMNVEDDDDCVSAMYIETTIDCQTEHVPEKFTKEDAKRKLDHIHSLLLDAEIDEECHKVVMKKLDEIAEILIKTEGKSQERTNSSDTVNNIKIESSYCDPLL